MGYVNCHFLSFLSPGRERVSNSSRQSLYDLASTCTPLAVSSSRVENTSLTRSSLSPLLAARMLANCDTSEKSLALALIANTRRRRRAETLNKKAQNSSINFIRHLATIYTDDTDYRELLRIEKRVLLYKLRKEFYFDMRTRDFSEVSQFASILAASRGLNEERVKEVLSTLEELTASGVQVDAKSYRLCLELLETLSRPGDKNDKK